MSVSVEFDHLWGNVPSVVVVVIVVVFGTVRPAVSPLPEPVLTFSEAWVTEIVGAVTAHGLASEHMVLREATNPPFETKSVTPEESSEALPAKIAVI